jgi:hypothetical protein
MFIRHPSVKFIPHFIRPSMKNDDDQRKFTETMKQPQDASTGRAGAVPGKPFTDLLDIFLLFLISRGVLTVIGVLSLKIIGRQTGNRLEWEHPPYLWLDVWGQWDTGWYLNIAKHWYTIEPQQENFANYAFFPFYPTLVKLLGGLIGNHFVAGLMISNVALLGAAVLLYKLVLFDHDRDVAMNSVKYLFIWPSSFVLSAILTEGLFLLLLVAGFYHMRKHAWLNAGMTGFLLSLTRIVGICFSLPLLYEYMKARKFSLRAIKAEILWLALVPAGFLLFCVYNYYLTGDLLAFIHQPSPMGRRFGNPLTTLLYGMAGIKATLSDIVGAWFTGVVLTVLVLFYRKVPVPQLLFCMIAIFIPLSTGLMCMPRYLAVLFPVFVLFAQLGKDKRVDLALTISFVVLQWFMMVTWSIGTNIII